MTSDSASPAKRRKITPSSKTNNTSITSSNSRRAGPYGGSSKVRARRSIWNAPDDWDELVAASNLSTSSVSTRRPPLREVPSLAKAAEDVAVRAFRLLWADGKTPAEAVNPESRTGAGKGKRKVSGERDASRDEGQMQKGWWELQWPHVPDHLKARVRDGVIRMHGGALSMDVIRKLFLFPPEYLLPGHLLPALSSAKSSSKTSTGLRTIPLHPHPAYCKQMTTLKIQHCPQYSDAAFADMVRMMPQLQTVNLKGCTLVGEQTVKAVIKLEGLRRVNLKGTRVTEGDVRELLGKKGGGLVGFKVDNVVFKDPSSVFTDAYPLLTHLCLPGTIINGPRNTSSDPREKMYNQTIAAVAPRATPLDATFTWSAFGRFFPALTHLYLPGLLIPPSDTIDLADNDTLVKLSLGIGGPQVPAAIVFGLLEKHARSLRKLHIGHLGGCDAEALGEVLANLEVLEDFRLIRDSQARVSAGCEAVMKSAGTWMPAPMARHWAGRLKYLHLDLGNHIPCEVFFNAIHPQGQSEDQVHGIDPADTVLESLSLSNTPISGPLPDYIAMPVGDAATEDPARPHHTVKPYHAVRLFPLLRSLDLSNTDITTEEVYDILDMCPLLTRVDLTSCRGVDVRMRRRIFAGWAESRGVRGS